MKRFGPLKKTKLKPHLKKEWCIPTQYSGEFVARMEDVLEVYALPYDESIPLICMDEQPCQLLDEKLAPLPMREGKIKKEDYEYVRKGTCSIFVFSEPLAGWRHVHASKRRTKIDWALHIEELLDVYYPNAAKIRLVDEVFLQEFLGEVRRRTPPGWCQARTTTQHHTKRRLRVTLDFVFGGYWVL